LKLNVPERVATILATIQHSLGQDQPISVTATRLAILDSPWIQSAVTAISI